MVMMVAIFNCHVALILSIAKEAAQKHRNVLFPYKLFQFRNSFNNLLRDCCLLQQYIVEQKANVEA